jgi:lipopolysaccharide/colanic/teichoic acid biosynthesis glycosyltransferase
MKEMYRKFFKRIIDIILSLAIIILLSPLTLVVFVLLFFSNSGSVFFKQERPGLNGRIFILRKFKTMNERRDIAGKLLPDAKRLTRTGKFIRSTSLDELPQLFNVLAGHMSLVGPRPLLVKYLPLYSTQQNRRHEVRPGITGWAQVNGRNAISWQKKFELDVWYVDNQSFALDVKVLMLTLQKVVQRKGITSTTSVTVESFNGKN